MTELNEVVVNENDLVEGLLQGKTVSRIVTKDTEKIDSYNHFCNLFQFNNSIDYEVAVRLLKIRSKAMQDSMPLGTGGMVAIIGCKDQEINKLLKHKFIEGKVFIANDNANGQIVISGEKKAINFILENTKPFNIRKAIQLPVSAPFHCKLMQSASEVMEWVSQIDTVSAALGLDLS